MSKADRIKADRCRYCGADVDRWHLSDGRVVTVEPGTMFNPIEASHWPRCRVIEASKGQGDDD